MSLFVSVLVAGLAQAFPDALWNAASLRTGSARSVSDTIVAAVDRLGHVAGKLHGDSARDAPTLEVTHGAAAQVVDQPARHAGFTADAICDRLLHNAHRIALTGPSRRKENTQLDA